MSAAGPAAVASGVGPRRVPVDAHADPGEPDRRSAARYLWWLVACQPGRSVAGAVLASVWMVGLAATPYLMARAVDEGLAAGDRGALAGWCAALVGVGAVNAWLGMLRHRTMTRMRMDAHFRTVKVLVDHAVRLGAALSRRTGAGEVVTIGVGDVQTVATSLTAVGPGLGALVAVAAVAALLLSVSGPLAVVVLLGVPVLALLVGPLMRRLQGRESGYRERQGALTARIADLAGGLRVLGGLGGKDLFAAAFRRDSARLREQGYRVGAVTSWLEGLGAGLPVLFLAVVTWLGARLAVRGEISVGDLVSVYGYVAALMWPVAFLVECGGQISRALVAADRVAGFLRLEPDAPSGTAVAPAGPSVLADPASGVTVRPGGLTALASAHPADAAGVLERLGRYTPSSVTWGGVPLAEVPLPAVRSRILLADPEADLFTGPLADVLGAQRPPGRPGRGTSPRAAGPGAPDMAGGTARGAWAASRRGTGVPRGAGAAPREAAGPWHGAAGAPRGRAGAGGPDGSARAPVPGPRDAADRWTTEADVDRALYAAAADDVVHALPDGLGSLIDPQGRNLSGGQRQRVRLARALLADPEVLLAAEPTSALDAHTEERVAERLRDARRGRTTVVTSTSPLVLGRADTVHYLADGRVVATGTHTELLEGEPGYRALVARSDEEAVG